MSDGVPTDFDHLVDQALRAPVAGWDFSWLADRWSIDPLPWSYEDLVTSRAARVETMLDMGTGGGEVLAGLAVRAPHTVATEAWPPSVPVARRRLAPLGIEVVEVEGAPDNPDQGEDGGAGGLLPFPDASFELIVNRHEAFAAAEVARVLTPGGTFVTQQTDFHNNDDLLALFGRRCPPQPDSWIELAVGQCEGAGLAVVQRATAEQAHKFHDVGALVYYLRVVSWAVPGFDVDADRAALLVAHEQMRHGPLEIAQRRFVLIANRPG